LMDIPTPFLWPISTYKINGIPWSHQLIFFPNIILLVFFYFYFFVYKKRKK